MSNVFLPCYVETNTTNPSVLGDYRKADGSLLFDLGILFAANINGTPDDPVLSFNSQLQAVLASGAVAELKKKGLKVSLSILGNHHTAGLASLTPKGVDSFVSQLVQAVNTYDFDGLDFDDEYTTGNARPGCFIEILQGLRKQLPSILLTLYAIGPVMNQLTYNGVEASSLLDYAWNPYYGVYAYGAPDVPGATKSQLGAAAIKITAQTPEEAKELAERTVKDGYGVCMMYNLLKGDHSKYLSEVSNVLYGQDTLYKP
jgi:hypothetical protein